MLTEKKMDQPACLHNLISRFSLNNNYFDMASFFFQTLKTSLSHGLEANPVQNLDGGFACAMA